MDDTRSPAGDLVEAVLAGQPGAFERLVREHQGLCWHIIIRMVRNPEDARDLCQDTFLRVHRCLHQYRYESALKSWIGRVAYSIALRYLERKRIPLAEPCADDGSALIENIAGDFDLESACADEEIVRHLHRAIETLPPLQRRGSFGWQRQLSNFRSRPIAVARRPKLVVRKRSLQQPAAGSSICQPDD